MTHRTEMRNTFVGFAMGIVGQFRHSAGAAGRCHDTRPLRAILPSTVRRHRGGFGLVETVVGAAIISTLLLALAQVGQFTLRLVDESNFKLRALFLAEEGVEAVRTLRDASFTANVAPLQLSQTYYPVFAGGAWQADPKQPSFVDGAFERSLRFYGVWRDNATDAIKTSGTSTATDTLDPNSREVRVRVAWSNRGSTSTIEIATFLTDLFSN